LAGYSPHTVKLYRKILGWYALSTPDLLAATPADVVAFLEQYEHHSPSTRRAYRACLGSFYTWAIEQADLLDRSPMVKIPSVKVPPGTPRPVTEPQLARALLAADQRMSLWLLLAGDAGLRISEIAAAYSTDLIGRHLHVEGKGRRQRTVPVSRRLHEAWEAWTPGPNGRMWTITAHTVGVRISGHLRSVGVDATAHQLRHRFGTRFYQASRDLLLTQQVMGHASSKTTEVYAAFDDRALSVVDSWEQADTA
jgi:integrase/recombinase XerC